MRIASSKIYMKLIRCIMKNFRAKLESKALYFNNLSLTVESSLLADAYIKNGAIPKSYPEDAMHIAIAAVNEIDYLLSWNFEHIVKIKTRKIISMVNTSLGYAHIEIITPAEII